MPHILCLLILSLDYKGALDRLSSIWMAVRTTTLSTAYILSSHYVYTQ